MRVGPLPPGTLSPDLTDRSNQALIPSDPVKDKNTYLMPTSPAKGRRGSTDYRPNIKKTVGNVPACLVNASVTYCGNDQIYAFGGFDQYTDEGSFSVSTGCTMPAVIPSIGHR